MDVKEVVDAFTVRALSGMDALIANHQAEDDEAILKVLHLTAAQLRQLYGDTVADCATSAIEQWLAMVRQVTPR